MRQIAGQRLQCVDFAIASAEHIREALARLRYLENATKQSSLGRELASLELAISVFLASYERPAA